MHTGSFNTKIVITDNWLEEISKIKNKVLIVDSNIRLYYNELLSPLLLNSGFFEFNASESNKNLNELTKILDFVQKANVNRNFYIVCIGGGITTDIGALAASIYMRGCRLILIPTTFLGMIDAAIGGKTAVNFNGIKNNIGTFYPAEKVIISTDFLKSLPAKDMKNGWAECLKVALIKPEKLMPLLINHSSQDLKDIVSEAVAIKESIVLDDLHEKGNRRILNLGHSFGHIIESISEYQITHGEAVSVGICAAAYISMKMNFLVEPEYEKILNLFLKYKLTIKLEKRLTDKIAKLGENLLMYDKKKTEDYNFILLRSIGDAFVFSIQEADTVFKYFIEYLN
jgi:3-dehydroquinate synthase